MFTLSPPTCFANSYMGKNEATTFIFDDCCAMGSDKLELDMTNVLEVSSPGLRRFQRRALVNCPAQ